MEISFSLQRDAEMHRQPGVSTIPAASRVSPSSLHLSGHLMLQSEKLLWILLFRFGHPHLAPHQAPIKLYQPSAFIHSDAFSEFCRQICWCTICCTFPEYSQLELPVLCEAARATQ